TNLFSSVNKAFYFSILPQANQDVLLNLNLISGSGALNVFVGQGYMPDPLHFDFRQIQWNSTSPSAIIPGVSSQPYYVLVVPGSSSNAPSLFSISAKPLGFQLSGVSPGLVGNGGLATLQIQGSQLSAGLTYQIVEPGGAVHNAVSINVVNDSQVAATF